MKRAGFTLIELLCVLVISGILLTVLTNGVANGLTWARLGLQEAIIGEQLEHALDLIERDVRGAKGINTDIYRDLNGMRTYSLHLISVDEGDSRKEGRIAYTLATSVSRDERDVAPERPDLSGRMTLYRNQEDSLHRGASQPVAMYLNSNTGLGGVPHGLVVTYYDRYGQVCAVGEEVASVAVTLRGTTDEGVVVTRSRQIPITVQYE